MVHTKERRVSLQRTHQPEIQAFLSHKFKVFSTNSPTDMPALASGFFLLTFSYFQIIICLPSLHGRAKHVFGGTNQLHRKNTDTNYTHVLLSAPRY